MTTANLLLELFVEELPPRALKALGQRFAQAVAESLQQQGLRHAQSEVTPFATPRRLAVHITQVLAQAAARPVHQKLMPVHVGLDARGQATPPLLKKLQALGLDEGAVPQLLREGEGKKEMLYHDSVAPGVLLQDGLQQALDAALAALPIPAVMSYPLYHGTPLPGWDTAQFVRPAHALVALHGGQVVPVAALGLQAGRETRGHRFEAQAEPIVLASADAYEQTLLEQGAVVASYEGRRALIARQLQTVAAQAGPDLHPVQDEALLDEVTALVERPHVLLCAFDEEFLQVPAECLILTMKANQKYFPLLDGKGQLSRHFLVVSNLQPQDPGAIITGNQRVVRARLADARFFYEQDRKQSLQDRLPGLEQVVYHHDLGTQAQRSRRVAVLAGKIGNLMGGPELAAQAQQAARLAKVDLLTGMVGEFPELQGTMGRYYALHDGLPEVIADAIEDHYKPRFAGDALPRSPVGTAVALADKLETLLGLFGVGQPPTGDKDPFALRRHALGIIRMLIEQDLPLPLPDLLDAAWPAGGKLPVLDGEPPLQALAPDTCEQLRRFLDDRLSGYLRELGYSTEEVEAVVSLQPVRLDQLPRRLQAVRAFARLPEAPALAAANKRIGNILKKTSDDVAGDVRAELLQDPAERALHGAMQTILPQASRQFDDADYTASLQTLATLRTPVDEFFEQVMVNAEDTALRQNRLALLAQLHGAMNRVADLSRLAA